MSQFSGSQPLKDQVPILSPGWGPCCPLCKDPSSHTLELSVTRSLAGTFSSSFLSPLGLLCSPGRGQDGNRFRNQLKDKLLSTYCMPSTVLGETELVVEWGLLSERFPDRC